MIVTVLYNVAELSSLIHTATKHLEETTNQLDDLKVIK